MLKWSSLAVSVLLIVRVGLCGEVEYRDGILYEDNRPFFPVGAWIGNNTDLRWFRQLGFNTALVPTSPDSGFGMRPIVKRQQDVDLRSLQSIDRLVAWGDDAVHHQFMDRLKSEHRIAGAVVPETVDCQHRCAARGRRPLRQELVNERHIGGNVRSIHADDARDRHLKASGAKTPQPRLRTSGRGRVASVSHDGSERHSVCGRCIRETR